MNPTDKKHPTKKKFFLVATILTAVMLVSVRCENPSVLCTDKFVSISLRLVHPDGQPVLLDSSKVFWVSQNRYLEEYWLWWYHGWTRGFYLIVDDGMQRELQNRREIMRFTGYLNGEIVHQQDVLVGANRCHVIHLGTEPLVHVLYDIPDPS